MASGAPGAQLPHAYDLPHVHRLTSFSHGHGEHVQVAVCRGRDEPHRLARVQRQGAEVDPDRAAEFRVFRRRRRLAEAPLVTAPDESRQCDAEPSDTHPRCSLEARGVARSGRWPCMPPGERNEHRADTSAARRSDCRVAWKAIANRSLPLSTDAGARRERSRAGRRLLLVRGESRPEGGVDARIRR